MDFNQAWGLLSKASRIGDGLSKEEALAGIYAGEFHLWTGRQSAALSAEEGKTIRIGLAGGELAELKEIEKQICEYAKCNGFTNVEIVGRPGWERELGYDRVAVVMRKNI